MKVIVLAGGNDQMALMKELRNIYADIEIILIDYSPDVVASKFADKHFLTSTMDIEKVKQITIDEKVDYVLTACGDQPLLTMAVVSEDLGLPCYLTKKQVLNLTNKMYMKNLMMENNIATSKFKIFSSVDSLDVTGLQYPLIVKPVDSNGSKGVSRVATFEELSRQAKLSFEYSLTKTIIVEEFVNGVEISADFYVIDGQVQKVMISQLNKFNVDDSTSVIYQSIVPPNINRVAEHKLRRIASDIAVVFEIVNSPLLIQAIVNGDDVNVIEFSARLGGGAKYKSIQNITGFNVLKANIESMFGLKPKISINDDAMCYSRCHFYLKGGFFSKIEGIEELLDGGIIEEYIQTKPYGVSVNSPRSSSDRVASVFIKALDLKSLREKVLLIVNHVKILDDRGKNIFEKSMYLNN